MPIDVPQDIRPIILNLEPMLSSKLSSLRQLKGRYPLLVQPKLDGIRCIIHPTKGPITRSGKPIRNNYIRKLLNRPELWGLEGELLVVPNDSNLRAPNKELVYGNNSEWLRMLSHNKGVFKRTLSGVMKQEGRPKFKFVVFDIINQTKAIQYRTRVALLRTKIQALEVTKPTDYSSNWVVESIKQNFVIEESQVRQMEDYYLKLGYEGIMLKSPVGQYYGGRTSVGDGYSMKWKRFNDAEAKIIGFVEQKDKRGNLKGRLGALEVIALNGPYKGKKFKVGGGFRNAKRQRIWDNQNVWLGETITFKYQYTAGLESNRPRFPSYLRKRPTE